MNTTMRKLLTVGLLSLCAAGMSAQSQTASPGPSSRNANVDKEDPNKPDTPEHEIPNQEAPGSGDNDDGQAAGTVTPSGGDGSATTENRDPTQPIPRNSAEQNAENSDDGQSTDKEHQGDRSNDEDQDDDTGDDQGAATSTQSDNGQQQPAKQTPPDPQR